MIRNHLKYWKSYKFAWIIYSFLMILCFQPYFFGKVIAPNTQRLEMGLKKKVSSPSFFHSVETKKLSDHPRGYVPEASQYLKGARSGWLSLWVNQNELGRPAQLTGFSPAYFPYWILAQFTQNPWQFITIISLFTTFMAGAFILLFCREMKLNPLAGLIASITLAASPAFVYWLTFPIFLTAWCWSAGALWAVTRLENKPDFIGWSALAFSGYSLLMTAYPQSIVFHAYLLGGYTLYLAYRKGKCSLRAMRWFLFLVLSALMVSMILVLPAYRDLFILFSESGRIKPDLTFFTSVLPKFTDWNALVQFFVLGTAPEILGNPMAPTFPYAQKYSGLTLTPLTIFLAIIGFFTVFKRTWGWWLAIGLFCLLTFVEPLYAFGVKYLGFNLSRSTPLGIAALPITVIIAYSANSLIKRMTGQYSNMILFAIVCLLMIILTGIGYAFTQSHPVHWHMVLVFLVLSALLATQYQQTHPFFLLLVIIIQFITLSRPLMLHQYPDHIIKSSPLSESVKANLPPESRFAQVSSFRPLLPNLNATLNLPSVHSYNSLSSKRYHRLIEGLGGEVKTYGRVNRFISPDYASAMFWMSNVGLILSSKPLTHENLRHVGTVSGIHLHKVMSRMGSSLQISLPKHALEKIQNFHIKDPRIYPKHTPIKRLDKTDLLEFEVTPMLSSILILSQKFHRDWQAFALTLEGWKPTQTIEINGVFQGAVIPPNAQRIRLAYKPLVRYLWVTHLFWCFVLIFLGMKIWKTHWRRRSINYEPTYPI